MSDQDPFSALLPEGAVSLGFVACVKVMMPDGEVQLRQVRSNELYSWEAAGMMLAWLDDQRAYMSSLGSDAGGSDDQPE